MEKAPIVDFLKKSVPLFEDFPAAQLQELVDGSRTTTFEPNEAIIAFGQEGQFLGVMLDGEAEASNTDDSGEKRRIGMLKAGDIFGEMSLMTGDRTIADIIGISRCTVLLIPQDLFSSILVTHPPAIRYLSKTIRERVKALSLDERGSALSESAFRKNEDPYGFKLHGVYPEKILVVNCGSSSLKYNLFDTADDSRNARGSIEKIGEEGTSHTLHTARGDITRDLPKGTHGDALKSMVAELTAAAAGVLKSSDEITIVGHRVVHGGDKFSSAEIITDDVQKAIEELSSIAPLHNPVNVIGIKEARRIFKRATHVAVFDTAFHQTMPPYAYLYGLPYELYERERIRRYGFHGMSHSYVGLKAAQFLKRPFNAMEIISCHLGNGASVCAIDHGRSVDTSMGFTPAEGLIMGTRCGNVDPAALAYLMRTEGMALDDLDLLINKKSGLKGLSGLSNDMRIIEDNAQKGHNRALLAFKTYCYQVRKYIGAYFAAMGGLDVLIFTGGIGQGSAGVRSLACQGLGSMGIVIDEKKNAGANGFTDVSEISAASSPVKVLVVPTNEELMIAREALRAQNRRHVSAIISTQKAPPVPIEVSAHHVHLSQEHVEALFGPGHRLTPESGLSQPGQYACAEKVNLIGPKGRIERVRVLGPVRKETQVEVAMTEQFKLGIHPPIRESGDIEETPGITLEGSCGTVVTNKGVICAHRHIHMSPEDALQRGLADRFRVRVRAAGGRELIFGDVLVRVHPDYRLAMHIDTDEANAANITTGRSGLIDGVQSQR
jgi:acetate kinase